MVSSWRELDLFGIKDKRTSISQEVLAGVMGWQTVVSSSALYASIFIGDDGGVDQDATIEMFMVVGGLSTIVFAVTFNVPYIVAPSILYASRESGVSVGGHLAAQAVANFAAAVFFFFAVKPSFMAGTPTALRLGAGCGICMLVSVLGMRGVGLLTADSFALQPFTWQSVVGLAIVAVACCKARDRRTRKSVFVVGVPFVLTTLAYAVFDRSKFQGYSAIEHPPLSNWGAGTFGAVDFSMLWDESKLYLYVIRTTTSIVINICSILFVLIDAVSLQETHELVGSSEKMGSHALGGTKKLRSMACSIPLMSSLGNLAGVTSQAAFVESMIVTFAGGKTGLSAAVSGALLVLSTVLRPLLPVLVPEHVSGALSVVITVRYFSVALMMIDVSLPSNLLMFGVTILVIPFSFDFLDTLCIATVLGFACEIGDMLVLRQSRHVKVGVSAERETAEEEEVEEGSDTFGLTPSTSRVRRQNSTSMAPPTHRTEIFQTRAARGSIGSDLLSLHSSNVSGGLRASQRTGSCTTHHSSASVNVEKTTPPKGSRSVHWGIALAAALQLALSAISDKVQS